mgnify:CR=1 FL=1
MKKLVATILTLSFLTISSAYAAPSFSVGVSANYGVFAATGKQSEYSETGTLPQITEEYGAFAESYGSIFVELDVNETISIGLDYVPSAIVTPENVNSSGLGTGTTSAGDTSKVHVDIVDLTTLYAIARLPVGGLYAKVGISTMDVETNETQRSGNTYPDTESDGVMVALGLEREYSYIKKSLINFPSGKEQIRLAISVGFKKAEYRTLAMGQMGILLLIA